MARRSRLEIYFDILEAIDNGTEKPTHIMYETNLSWKIANNTIETLLKSDFIREEQKKSSKRYAITEKGRNALSNHRKSIIGLTPLIP